AHGSISLLGKDQAAVWIEIDSHKVTKLQLRGCHETGQRRDEVLLDRSFQMTSSILCIGTFFQKKVLHCLCTTEEELLRARGCQDALLHHLRLGVEDMLQMIRSPGFGHGNRIKW